MSPCTDLIHDALTVDTHRQGDTLVLVLRGELTRGEAQRWRQMLFDQLADADALVVLDLSEMCFMSASGIGLLVDLHREGRRFALAAPSAPVRDLLRLTQVDTILPVWDTVDAAVRAELEPTGR